MHKAHSSTRRWLLWSWIGLGVALLLGIGLALMKRDTDTATPDPSPSPTASAAVSPTPTASATPSQSPTASPSPTASAGTNVGDLPVADFYAAYKGVNAVKLETFFTADVSESDKFLNSVLFTGKDLNGNQGGPTLFVSTVAGDTLTSYTVLSVSGTSRRLVTLEEKRRTAEGKDITVKTEQTWVVVDGSNLLDRYTKIGASGKYDAFLTP